MGVTSDARKSPSGKPDTRGAPCWKELWWLSFASVDGFAVSWTAASAAAAASSTSVATGQPTVAGSCSALEAQ